MTDPAEMALEAVQPLALAGVEPCIAGREPQVVWLSIRDLRIDRRYQRGLSETSRSLIRRMVEGWDWALCGPVTVAELPGGLYELLDGQHRATAALTAGLHRLPAVIVEARDTAERARVFRDLNTSRVKVGQGALFRAALASGDRDALALDALVRDCGARIVLNNRPSTECNPGDTLAISTLQKLRAEHGGAVLRRALSLAVAAGVTPIRGPQLRVLADLMAMPEYAETDLDPLLLAQAFDAFDAWRRCHRAGAVACAQQWGDHARKEMTA